MTTTILGVDVSSHNPPRRPDLDQWVGSGCQVLLIHSYSHVESPGLDASTRQWAAIAREAGVWRIPYLFLFSSDDPGDQVRSSLATWRSAGEVPGVLVLDCEEYEDSLGPSVDQIIAAVEACHAEGVNTIGYSRKNWIQARSDYMRLGVISWWLADYDSTPTLDIPTPPGFTLVGHQYSNAGPDWSCWDLAALQALAGGYVAPDPCAALRQGVQDAIGDLDALRTKLAALMTL